MLRREVDGQRSAERRIHGVASAHSGMMATSAMASGTKRSILPSAISRTATNPIATMAMNVQAMVICSARGRRARAGAIVRIGGMIDGPSGVAPSARRLDRRRLGGTRKTASEPLAFQPSSRRRYASSACFLQPHSARSQTMKMSPVIHFEMPAENRERMARFYTDVFGWHAEMMGPEMGDYVVVATTESDDHGPKKPGAINGGFFPKKP